MRIVLGTGSGNTKGHGHWGTHKLSGEESWHANESVQWDKCGVLVGIGSRAIRRRGSCDSIGMLDQGSSQKLLLLCCQKLYRERETDWNRRSRKQGEGERKSEPV